MTNACLNCAKSANDAWDKVTDFLFYPPMFITRQDLERYRGILDALVAELEEDGSL